MNLIDVTGRDKYLINLDLVRRITTEDFGRDANITFVYANGDENTFKVSSGRLAVLLDTLLGARVA